ncbi:MAG: alcohol dehydrogenase catalytic domain-containing protein [Chloroflexi bacterium]|nr:alcohol dehydrogenase catalytic domain-containing protein [Chloroflexota bacterium]
MKALVLDAQWDPRPDYAVSEWEKQTGKAITGSSVWRHPKLQVQTVPDPKPGPDDVLLKIKACGVCGSDIHFYEHDKDDYILYPGLTKFPTTTGHEFSGEVVEVGANVRDLKVGDMVTAEEMIWCGYCTPCRNGYPNHCVNLEEIGFTIPGAFAEYLAIGAKYCWKLDAIADRYGSVEKAFEAGSVVEPTSVAYNGMFPRAGGFAPGAFVAVFGAGPIGLAAIALARASGAGIVAAFEVSPNRQAIAKTLGADFVYDPRKVSPSQVLMELSKGEGFDFMVEAAGAPNKTIPEMEKAMAINGKIVQIGRAAERVPMYLETLQVRRGQVFGAQGHSGDAVFPSVIRMMASGRLDMTQMITARYDLAKTVDAIAASGERFHGKITVKP